MKGKSTKNNKSMNILIICETFYPRLRGGEVVLWNVSKSLIKKGHNVQVITSKLINTKSYEKKLGVKIHRPFPLNNVGKTTKIKILLEKISFNLKLYKFIKLFIKENKIDIIYNQAYPLTFVASIIASKNNIPLIISVGSYIEINMKKLFYNYTHLFHILKQKITLNFTKYEKIRVGSHYIKNKLNRYINIENIKVIPSPVDEEEILNLNMKNKRQIRKDLNLSNEQLLLIFAGALEPVKNVKGIINSLKKVKRKYNFLIIGDGSEKEEIENILIENQLKNRIFLLGQKEHKDTLKYIKASDILLLCSEIETCGNVVLEALCLGTNVISTKTGIAVDLNLDNLHTVDNVNDIIPKIENWVYNSNATNNLINKYSNLHISSIFEDMFNKAIEHHKT